MYTINLTQQQFEELQNNKTLTINVEEPKQEKWTPSGGEWNAALTEQHYKTTIKNEKYTEAGIEYETEEEAIKASKAIRAYARQLKWLSENNDDWIADWNNMNKHKYYIYYGNTNNKYSFAANQSDETLGTIYMSRENAEKLCRLLNEGVVEF